jgi:hypothetical protein
MPAKSKRTNAHGSLEIPQDMAFQRRSWRVQRVGWAVLALIVAAGLAGLAGSGPLSPATQESQDASLRLEYDRFTRMHAPSRLRLHFGTQAVRAGEVRIWLDRSYMEQVKLERVVPQPQQVQVGEKRLVYVFAAEEGQPGAVTFEMQHRTFGRISGRAGIGDAVLEYRQLVYP